METQRLLFLAVLLLSTSQIEAEVVQSVSDCAQFFLGGTPPVIPGVLEGGLILNQNRYKPICQTYHNHQPFFTLYDTANKIPVFSAYKFTGEEKNTRRPTIKWMIEPQLENNMEILGDFNCQNQASNNDYKNYLGFDRGHLFPSSYGFTQRDKNSTFTLTNAVPQAGTFNKGSWNNMENCIKCVMRKYCKNNNNKIEGFLATGAEPSNQLLNDKINIPSVMWSAFCCYSSSGNTWLASAHWGNNVPDVMWDQHMETKTLFQLQSQFSRNTAFQVFPQSQCPLYTTVTEFYPELNAEDNNCNCPSTPTTTTPPPPTTAVPPKTPIRRPTRTTTATKNKNQNNQEKAKEIVGKILTTGGLFAGGAVVGEALKRIFEKARLVAGLCQLLKMSPSPNLFSELALEHKNTPLLNRDLESPPVENKPDNNVADVTDDHTIDLTNDKVVPDSSNEPVNTKIPTGLPMGTVPSVPNNLVTGLSDDYSPVENLNTGNAANDQVPTKNVPDQSDDTVPTDMDPGLSGGSAFDGSDYNDPVTDLPAEDENDFYDDREFDLFKHILKYNYHDFYDDSEDDLSDYSFPYFYSDSQFGGPYYLVPDDSDDSEDDW